MRTFKLFFAFALIALLTGCAFHLRQASSIPPNFKTIYIASSTPYGTFETNMKNNLRAEGFNVVTDEKNAALIFESSGSNFSSSDTTLPSLQSRVYTFTFVTSYVLRTKEGQTIIPLKSVSASRSATLTVNEVLGSSNQVNTIRQELMRNTINQILNQINAEAVTDTLQKINAAPKKPANKT